MIQTVFSSRRKIASIALLAMLLRIAVPAGFMPSSLADGWFLKLCPDGISTTALMALLGQEGHNHHHGSSADQGDSGEQSFDQCDLGSSFSSAFIFQSIPLSIDLLLVFLVAGYLVLAATQSRPHTYQARAPPQILSY